MSGSTFFKPPALPEVADYKSGNKGGRLAIWDAIASHWVPENVGDGVGALWSWLKTKIPSYDLFCSAIFLRQNETAHFLAGTAGDRNKRFAALINLDRYTDLSKKAQGLARKAEVEREVTRQRSKDLGDLSDEALQQLEKLLQDATNALVNAETAYTQARQIASAAEAWAHLQTGRRQQERRAQDIRELLREEDRIQTAAQRVEVWGKVASRLEQYWRWRGEANVHHANAAAKRAEAEDAMQKQQSTENSLAALQQRRNVIERDELPTARQQAEATRTRLLRLEHERKIAVARGQEISAQRDVEELAGADEAYVNWQNRSRALPRLQTLADARKRLKDVENAVPQAEATFNEASQKSEEAHKELDAIGHKLEEADHLRTQADERSRQVTVHVVPARQTCQRRLTSHMISTHGYHPSTVTRSVGTHASRSAGIYPCARSTGRGVGGYRATPPGAAADGLAELLAAAIA